MHSPPVFPNFDSWSPPAPKTAREPGGHPPLPARATDPDALPPTITTPPPLRPASPITTPPPLGKLAFSGSGWSTDWDDDAPAGARRPPRVGDAVMGFKLVGELGRGAFARVYLAHQEALANRPVALKVTLRPTREAERLARLQHTNVVPVYSVHDDGPVQVICMPYLGRVTIADLLRVYRSDPSSRASGRKGSTARAGRTTTVDSKSVPTSDGRTGAPRVPTWTWDADAPPPIVGDPLAVVQVLAQLADGLAHAHARGILHLDLKPANVLLADTGEPMLLDFNLSFDAARPDREMVGGTMPYMAVEQLLDMRQRGAGTLDARTDLYSLGVMAFEMLTGGVPFAPGAARDLRDIDGQVARRRAGAPPVRTLNPGVTPAVEAVVRKLLAPDPADRYQTADQLRTDLERHLNDLPLWFARESSVLELLGKWRRRNPGFGVRLMASGLIGLALGLGGVVHQRAETNARSGAVEQARVTQAALDAVRLDLALPGDPAARARGVGRAEELLAGYGLPDDPNWRKRSDVRRLSEAERGALAGDLGELLSLLAQARWQEADARPEAERRELAARAVGARALFLEAALAISAGRYATAIPLLDRVVADQPSHAAAQFALAYCRQQLGQYARALERYDVARVLLPKDPRPPFQRGVIYGTSKKYALAEAEFSKAIDLDPDHAEAYRFRGMTRLRIAVALNAQGAPAAVKTRLKLEEAEKDFTRALDRGASPLHVLPYRAAVRDTCAPAGAQADRDAVKNLTPKTEADYIARGTSRTESDPVGALADFRKAVELNPRSLAALQNQVHVLADCLTEKDSPGALVVVARLVELYPEFALARATHAVILARLGRRDAAHKEIEQAQLLSDDAEVSYRAACVYALTSAKNADDGAKALTFLRQAVRDGYSDLKGIDTAPDLESLRTHADFRGIRDAANTLFK